MLAQQDTDIKKAVTTVHRLTEDEEFRQQYEAREDRIRQQLDHDYWYDMEIKKRDVAHAAELAERDAAHATELAERDAAHATELAERDSTIADLEAKVASLQEQLANK